MRIQARFQAQALVEAVVEPNNAHALDGGIALQFHISDHWFAASDVIR